MYLKRNFGFLIVSILIFSYCFSQEDYNYINKISVTGNINVSADLIKSTSQLKIGDIYREEEINKAIKNKNGLFPGKIKRIGKFLIVQF